MKICPKCGFENPDRNSTCSNCGHIFRLAGGDPPNDELTELRQTIEGLQLELTGKTGELDFLKGTINSKDEEIAGLQVELGAKDAALESLRKKTEPKPETQSKVPSKPVEQTSTSAVAAASHLTPHKQSVFGAVLEKVEEEIHLKKPQGTPKANQGPSLSIDSYPLKNPNIHLTIDDSKQSIDLSATLFRIHAKVERSADGIDVIVEDGAVLNVRLSENQKWQRYKGGSRIKAAPGMILFDPASDMNARLESVS
jgi:hypothetical protein